MLLLVLLCMCCVHNSGGFLGGYPPQLLDTWVLGYPPTQLLMGKQWSNQSVSYIKSKLVQVKGLPNLMLLAFCMLQILIFSFWRKLKCKSSKCIPLAAKTEASVQHLFLHFLFTYTYLFSCNIMLSNLLSACNKDDKLLDHQKLTFEFFSRICLPHSP